MSIRSVLGLKPQKDFICISWLRFSLPSFVSPDKAGMDSKFDSFQKMLHDEFFNFYLGLPEEETDMEFSNGSILSLVWVISHIERLRAVHDMFYPILTDSCHKNVISGGMRIKLISEYCDFNLAVRECFKKILEGISYAQRWVRLANCVVVAFEPDPENLFDQHDFLAGRDPESDPVPLLTLSNLRNGTLCLSLLKEELSKEDGTYEHALLGFVDTVDIDEYQSPLDIDTSDIDEYQSPEYIDTSCYLQWCSVTSELLSDKLRLMANKLRQDTLSDNVNLMVYSMNFVMFWCAMVTSVAFVPRVNGQNYGKSFLNERIYSIGPKVPWKNASDSLLENIWEVLPEDLSHGSLKEIRRIAASTKSLSDLLDGVRWLSMTEDHIAEIGPHLDELRRVTSFFGGNLNRFKMKLKVIDREMNDCWGKAMDLMETYN